MPNTAFGHLPTVEDSSVGSGSTHASNANSVSNLNASHSSNSQQPRMKRSNYLSVMAGATKSSEDLVAMLSRPTPGAGSRGSGLSQLGGGGGSAAGSGLSSGLQLSHQSTPNSTGTPVGGRSNFFDLRRKNTVTPVPDFEEEGFDEGAQDKDPLIVGFGGTGDGGRRGSNPRPLPSLRSALRMSSRTDVKAMTNNAAAANAAQKMKKNMSSVQFANTMKNTVSFSNNTKAQTNLGEEQEKRQGNASFLFDHQQGQPPMGGGPQAQGGQGQQAQFLQQQQLRQFQTQQQPPKANYTAAMMMRKSQSIASPQMMLAHQNSIASSGSERTANETFAATSGGNSSNSSGSEGNASFPIYLAQVPAPAGVPTATQNKMSSFMDARRRCQSMAGGMGNTGGMTPVAHARPSSNGLNLTFKEMLDVGDGKEGDLNLRSRNHQWKDFQSFSSKFEETNPIMKAMAEGVEAPGSAQGQGSPSKEGDGGDSTSTSTTIPLSGSKRTLTPSSVNTVSTGSSKNSGGNQGFPPVAPNSGGMPNARTLMGSHRASVSVNDLAVLRRAAGRMKMNNPAVGNSSRQTTTQPGQMLGGDMLNRISGLSRIPSSANSEASQSGSRASGSGGEAKDLGEGKLNNALSPLAQMMARSTSRGALNAGGGGGGGDGFANPAQRDLFFQKFNMAMSSSTSSNRMSSMGNENSASRAPAGLTPMQSMMNRSSNNNLSGMGGMGRRVRTVGAGLAYGRANMTNSIDYKSGFRMSKFDLGDLQRETSRLSEISNEGSTAGGKNEEWNLS